MAWKKTIDIKRFITKRPDGECVPVTVGKIADALSKDPAFDHLLADLRECETEEEADAMLHTVYTVADRNKIWLGL